MRNYIVGACAQEMSQYYVMHIRKKHVVKIAYKDVQNYYGNTSPRHHIS